MGSYVPQSSAMITFLLSIEGYMPIIGYAGRLFLGSVVAKSAAQPTGKC
jgi:hypothetical protein